MAKVDEIGVATADTFLSLGLLTLWPEAPSYKRKSWVENMVDKDSVVRDGLGH
jgi:hypothetical protein